MKVLLRAFDRMRLNHKLASLLSVIFVIALGLLLYCLNMVFSDYAVKQIDARAAFVMNAMNAVRTFTGEHLDPIVAAANARSPVFLPEAVPSYAAQQVFASLKSDPIYADYSYREAALNPTNMKDKADPEEAAIIRAFRANPDLTEVEGVREAAGGPTHYVARPIRVNEQKCLGCHATPQRAPASLVATYGSENGFGWRLGDVVAAQIVTVPTGAIHRAKWDALGLTALLNTAAFLTTGSVLLLFLSRAIVRPMRIICARAHEASIHPERVDFSEKRRGDEIGLLAQSFDRLKQSLLIAMQMLQQAPDGRPSD